MRTNTALKILGQYPGLDNKKMQKTFERELRSVLRKDSSRYQIETELYRYFQIPPFIITREKEILFTANKK